MLSTPKVAIFPALLFMILILIEPLLATPELWVQKYQSPIGTDKVNAGCVDSKGNIYLTGCGTGIAGNFDFCTIKYDSMGNELWMRRYNGPGNAEDQATSIFVDSSGNVYVTGYSQGKSTYYDYCTIKYDSNGNETWVKRYNGPGNSSDAACFICSDSSNNIFVTGYSIGSASGRDFCTIKYDSSGNEAWVKRYSGSGNYEDSAIAVCTDPVGNVYVTGYSYSVATSFDYCTIKYDAAGNELWVRKYNGPGNSQDKPASICTDSYGIVYVTGQSFAEGTSYDYCTIKYDSDGSQAWVRRYNGSGNVTDTANAICTDLNGSVYVTGHSWDINTGSDLCTIKYDSNGNEVWVRRHAGPAYQEDSAVSVCTDPSGNIFVTGYINDRGVYKDYCTIKYDSNGNELWMKSYNGPGDTDDYAKCVCIDSSGNAYVIGCSIGYKTNLDYCTIKYDTNGNVLWTKRYCGPGTSRDFANAMCLDSHENIYITGGPGVYCTVKYDRRGNELWAKNYFEFSNNNNNPKSICTDPSGNIYVTGERIVNSFDYLTVSYGPSGDERWIKRAGSPSAADHAAAICSDANGNVYLTGDSTVVTYDYCTIKYDSDGNEVWARYYSGPGNKEDHAYAICTDFSGNIYVTGYCTGSGTGQDYCTIKYDSDGNELWVRRYHYTSGDVAYSICVDRNGGVYVTGISYDTLTGSDFCTIKYDTNGNEVWVNRYTEPGSNSSDCGRSICIDSNQNVYVTGNSGTPVTNTYDYCTIKYDANGKERWVRRYNGPVNGEDFPKTICTDAGGNVFVTGYSKGSGGYYDYDFCTVKYDTNGNEVWVNRYNGLVNDDDRPSSMCIGSSGTIYVTGYTSDYHNNEDFCTIAYSNTGEKGAATINGGAAFTGGSSVVLKLSSPTSQTASHMRFSNDNTTWTGWEPFAHNKTWTLDPGFGSRSVYVQFRDAAGNVCEPASDSITVVSGCPGSISVNDGAAFTTTTTVNLALYATDAEYGVGSMCFSNDNNTWTDWEPYAQTKSWELVSGEGLKTVYARFKGSSGIAGDACSDTIAFGTPVSIAQAKAAAGQSFVILSGKSVAGVVDAGTYVEEDDRSMGILLTSVSSEASTRIDISGITQIQGIEKSISVLTWSPVGTGSIVPVTMINSSIGCGDWMYDAQTGKGQRGVNTGHMGIGSPEGLNNIGLLVHTSGRITYRGFDYLLIDDGSGVYNGSATILGLKVKFSGNVIPEDARVGKYMIVTGISSCELVGSGVIPVMRMRNTDDVQVLF